MHWFYPICSNAYKDKDEELEIPPHPMETDSVTMWHQDRIVTFGDEAVGGTLQRRSSRKVACDVNDAIKSLLLPEDGSSKSRVVGAPKR